MSTDLDMELMSDEEAQAFKDVPSGEDIEKEIAELKEQPDQPVEAKEEPAKTEEKEEVKEEAKESQRPEGILAKDGKNFIPFSVLEEERAKRQALEAKLAELEKTKGPEPVKPVKEVPDFLKIDAKAMGQKLYESEEAAAEVFAELAEKIQHAFEAGTKEAVNVVDNREAQAKFNEGVSKIRNDNPWITKDMEKFFYYTTLDLIDERKVGWNDIDGMLSCAREVVDNGKKLFTAADQSAVEKAKEEGRKEGIAAVMAKFNIKEPEAMTLYGMRTAEKSSPSSLDDIEKLAGLDFEEAFLGLTPKEREQMLEKAGRML